MSNKFHRKCPNKSMLAPMNLTKKKDQCTDRKVKQIPQEMSQQIYAGTNESHQRETPMHWQKCQNKFHRKCHNKSMLASLLEPKHWQKRLKNPHRKITDPTVLAVSGYLSLLFRNLQNISQNRFKFQEPSNHCPLFHHVTKATKKKCPQLSTKITGKL